MRIRRLLPAVLLPASLHFATPLAFSQTAQPMPPMQSHGPDAPPMDRGMDRDHGMDRGMQDDMDMGGGGHHWGGQGMRGEMGRGHRGGGEHGMWWKNPELATRIGLTPDQQKKMEDLFIQGRIQTIDLHASLEKEQLLLEPMMSANPVDKAKADAAIDKLADTRASLEKSEAKTGLSIRAVLTPDQWTKLHTRPEAMHPDAMHPDAMHRPEGGRMGPHHQMPGKPQAPDASNPPA
jgi:Spy/CpxP family protein refolding chaperone